MDRLFQKGLRLVKKNYLLSLFILAVCFVIVIVAYKLFVAKPTYIYAKVKVGQGYWWASTQKPSMWFVEAIKKTEGTQNTPVNPSMQVISVTFYPYFGTGQFDVYVVARLKVSKVGSGLYNFNRNTIGVGTPIDLEFNRVQFSGTIIDLSDQSFTTKYVTKTVTLTKKNTFPWEYDAIPVGGTYNNGQTNSFIVLGKHADDTYNLSEDTYGNYPTSNDLKKYITVKVALNGQVVNGQFMYAEDQVIIPGRVISLALPGFIFNDYTIANVQ